jgi:hypothetical protein
MPRRHPNTAAFVIGAYHQLFEIEKSFRMSKHDLQARPTRHYQRDSIEAHLTIVLAALAVSRSTEAGTGWSIRKFVRAARCYRTIEIRAGNHIITAADPMPRDLHEALGRIHHEPAAHQLSQLGARRSSRPGGQVPDADRCAPPRRRATVTIAVTAALAAEDVTVLADSFSQIRPCRCSAIESRQHLRHRRADRLGIGQPQSLAPSCARRRHVIVGLRIQRGQEGVQVVRHSRSWTPSLHLRPAFTESII